MKHTGAQRSGRVGRRKPVRKPRPETDTITTIEAAALLRMGRSRLVALSDRDSVLKLCRRWRGRGWIWSKAKVLAYREALPCERASATGLDPLAARREKAGAK